ncbi:MAG: FAD-dependent oxidoreductase [Betaproteobacteria bacterium]
MTSASSKSAAPVAAPIDRERLLAQLRDSQPWDAVVVGGGATGLGIAVDAAQRGLRVALIDSGDFARGTSSRSTKLVHGGVRYLAQGNVKLVREALAERATLLRNAPHVASALEFVVPCYSRLEQIKLRVGLGLYDQLAGDASLGPTRWLSRDETMTRLPGVRSQGLLGGVSYWDGQFDDALMCIALMQTAVALGAVAINYVGCTDLRFDAQGWATLTARDQESGERFALRSRCVFNAAGVWVDAIRQMADPAAAPLIRVRQGSHLVLDRTFMPGEAALLVPRTPDGRVLFAVPWLGRLLLGTTDEPRERAEFDPRASEAERDYILATARDYFARPPGVADVQASFSGLRPLYSPAAMPQTSAISREHAVIEEGGLFSVVGGKWTTYRKMAADALATAARAGRLPAGDSRTTDLALCVDPVLADPAQRMGAPSLQFDAHCRSHAQARSRDDVLYRRSRAGLLGTASA